MSLQMATSAPASRLTGEQRAALQKIAAPVGGAARFMIERHWTDLPADDLQALGMLAVWRKLPEYDPKRANFERWAFYVALHAMLDASRTEQKETLVQEAVRRGARGYLAQDDRPADHDWYRDTRETDRARLHARTRRMVASSVIQATIERSGQGGPIERMRTAAEAVRAVREEVAALPETRRTYVRLRFWDDSEVKAMAASIGVPERTLRRRWIETRDLLEARLRARGVFGVVEGFDEALKLLDAQAALNGEPDKHEPR